MAEITVDIGGRRYRLACGDGEEAHVRKLAGDIDAEAKSLAARMPSIPEARLLLMTALTIADRLHEASGGEGAEALSRSEAETARLSERVRVLEDERAEAIARIDALAGRAATG